MNGTQLQTLISKGAAIAGAKMGLSYSFYRPSGASNPISGGNLYATANAAFSVDPKFSKFNSYGHPVWTGYFDITTTLPGDYLVGVTTYFIGSQQPLLPTQMIECNRTITVSRPQITTGFGAQGYNGETAANETAIMTAWPASILKGSKGRSSEVRLPADTTNPQVMILLPHYPGITLHTRDLVADDLGMRYVIASIEETDLGWRMEAMQVQT